MGGTRPPASRRPHHPCRTPLLSSRPRPEPEPRRPQDGHPHVPPHPGPGTPPPPFAPRRGCETSTLDKRPQDAVGDKAGLGRRARPSRGAPAASRGYSQGCLWGRHLRGALWVQGAQQHRKGQPRPSLPVLLWVPAGKGQGLCFRGRPCSSRERGASPTCTLADVTWGVRVPPRVSWAPATAHSRAWPRGHRQVAEEPTGFPRPFEAKTPPLGQMDRPLD